MKSLRSLITGLLLRLAVRSVAAADEREGLREALTLLGFRL